MMKKLRIVLILILLLAACNGNDEDEDSGSVSESTTEQSDPAAEEDAPTEETAVLETVADPTPIPPTLTPPPPPPEAEESEEAEEESDPVVETVEEPAATQPSSEIIMIEASDGLQIQVTYSYPGGTASYPGVMLLHMLGSNRRVWEDNGLEAQLLQSGYAIMNVDMRGHGRTGGDRDWTLAEDDFLRVWDYFVAQDEVDGEKTAVIGASIGSNMSLITAVNQPSINTVVLLSPGLDYLGVSTDNAIVDYGDRPIFIVASEEDSYAADSSRSLHELAAGEAELQLYNGAGHGTNMFNKEEGLPDLILNWLQQHLS